MDWSCPYCGYQHGFYFEDDQLSGMVCLRPECGRFDPFDEKEGEKREKLYDSDL
ncbi:hypothetical protein [Thermicanus aegyptius]|uniref:hypothetical protein n=1 Tax=Thermicanus aegyptius TaxID=94009 RepID=UPI000346D371|nr:hypothetical protein [Thermicanus aegyptius]